MGGRKPRSGVPRERGWSADHGRPGSAIVRADSAPAPQRARSPCGPCRSRLPVTARPPLAPGHGAVDELTTRSPQQPYDLAPDFESSAALSADGKHAFEAYALDSFDEGLAIATLSFAREHGDELMAAPQRPLVLAEGFAHEGYAFDAVVATSPAIHRLYPDDPDLNSAVRALVPAFRREFTGDEDEPDAEYRYSRAAGVPGTK